MIATTLRKRGAQFKGEHGLFAVADFAEDDLRQIANGSDVLVRLTTPRNLKLLAYLWALATVVAESVDGLYDRDDAMEFLCVKAHYTRNVLDPRTGKLEIKRGSLSRLSNEAMKRLAERMKFIVVSELVPGMDEGALGKRLEEMVGA